MKTISKIILIFIAVILLQLLVTPAYAGPGACTGGDLYGSEYTTYCSGSEGQCNCEDYSPGPNPPRDPLCDQMSQYCDPNAPRQGEIQCAEGCESNSCSVLNNRWPCNRQGSCSWDPNGEPDPNYCAEPTPANRMRIQGWKVDGNTCGPDGPWNSPPNNDPDDRVSIAQSGRTTQADPRNPYGKSADRSNSNNVIVSVPSKPGYQISYKLGGSCSGARTNGNSVTFTQPHPQVVELWWYYTAIPQATNTPVPPVATPTPVPLRVNVRTTLHNSCTTNAFLGTYDLRNFQGQFIVSRPVNTLLNPGQGHTMNFLTYACTPGSFYSVIARWQRPNGGTSYQQTLGGVECGTIEPHIITCPPAVPTPTPHVSNRVNVMTTAGSSCIPDVRLDNYILYNYSPTPSPVENQIINTVLLPNQSNTTSFNYACQPGSNFRVRMNYRFPQNGSSRVYDLYGAQCGGIATHIISCPTPTPPNVPNPPPIGNNDGGACVVTGWACDNSISSQPIYVELYDGDITNPATKFLGRVYANDILSPISACGGTQNHWYEFGLPSNFPPGDQVLYAYARGIDNLGREESARTPLTGNPQGVNCSTPLNTPTPAPWVQLKNSSYQSGTILRNIIPLEPQLYDNSGDGEPYFIIRNSSPLRDAGAVIARGIDLGTINPEADVSAKKWSNAVLGGGGVNISSFIEYVKAKKGYITATGINTTLATDKINVIKDTNITIDNNNRDILYGKTPLMIILDGGNLTIDMPLLDPVFNPDKKPIVILVNRKGAVGGSLTFTPTTEVANGIFISNDVTTGLTTDKGLLIEGNLVSGTMNNQRKWSNNSRPSLYIINSPKMYLDLLKFMSKSTYEWKQLK